MNAPTPISEILTLDCADFIVQFYNYLTDKQRVHQPLTEIEEVAYLLLTMRLDIEMEGFVDLFYQLYSLRECSIVETHLRAFGLHQLAALFAEAKQLYTGGKLDITDEEYSAIDPFGTDERWQRFDAIGELILAEDSELYKLEEYVCAYVKAHADQLR
ncbi:MAG: DMP19 family protein [Chloroflexota bacterium]|nr:DMP19 family protein [Chloroflexota bacterium]